VNRGRKPARRSRPEGGYALLLAVFLAASMFVLASVAVPSIVNNGRRERERQLIWRGNQYVRGIRLYFQKNGRFPQNKEELLKGTLDVHFVRKAFTDPVGTQNADWRFIYVAPSGQLTGSVRYHSLQEMAGAQGGGQAAASLAALFGGGAAAAQGAGNIGAGAAAGRGGGGGGAGALAGGTGGAGDQTTSGGLQPAGSGPTAVPLQAVDGPVFGASLIGVASKVKQDSLMVYQGKDTYVEWEFIWNPLLNGGPGGTPTPQAGGVPGAGGAPATDGTGVGQQQGPGPGQMPGTGLPGR